MGLGNIFGRRFGIVAILAMAGSGTLAAEGAASAGAGLDFLALLIAAGLMAMPFGLLWIWRGFRQRARARRSVPRPISADGAESLARLRSSSSGERLRAIRELGAKAPNEQDGDHRAAIEALSTFLRGGENNRTVEERREAVDALVLLNGRLEEGLPGRPDLRGARLEGARFEDADLLGFGFGGAWLRAANFRGADMQWVVLTHADLEEAVIENANLTRAELCGAKLRGARLHGANLYYADFSGADLSETLGLSQEQLEAALGDGSTRLPGVLDRPAHWGR